MIANSATIVEDSITVTSLTVTLENPQQEEEELVVDLDGVPPTITVTVVSGYLSCFQRVDQSLLWLRYLGVEQE